MLTRRHFLQRGAQVSVAAATASLWSNSMSSRAFAQMSTPTYKAVVVISMQGGNDGNNMIIPLDSASYAGYAKMRGNLALPASTLLPLTAIGGAPAYGLHPQLPNLASLFNSKRAAVVANVGPLVQPMTKAQTSAPVPSLFSHPAGIAEWESSSASNTPSTGWGGRIADLISHQSGSLPPVLNTGEASVFTVGQSVQAVAVQGGTAFAATVPPALNQTILKLAESDTASTNRLVSAVASLRAASLRQQTLIDQACTYRTLKTQFPNSGFGTTMNKIAQVIGGHTVIGASRQIFYAQQGKYDTHTGQLNTQLLNFVELDAALGCFFQALDELGMTDQVLVCTHSDFNRTGTPNTDAGSDHGWGNHQFVMGGGIPGGTILGTMPILEVNGPDDFNGLGVWVPTTSVTQFTAGIGGWMGLTSDQLTTVFPDLVKFPNGALKLS